LKAVTEILVTVAKNLGLI